MSGTVKRWCDPCPRCGAEVTDWEHVPHWERDNPQAVVSVGGRVIVNPAPDPMYDHWFSPYATMTLRPCGDTFQIAKNYMGELAGWKMYEQREPEVTDAMVLAARTALGDDAGDERIREAIAAALAAKRRTNGSGAHS